MEKAESELELIQQNFGPLSGKQIGQLAALEHLYKDWNSRINIISRKDMDHFYRNHVLHSLTIALVFTFIKGQQVIDIGTGGGFPGIPLAILFPDTSFHLVDSIGKKIKVVQAVSNSIGLENVTAEHGRVEDIRKRKFDAAVSRAVAPLGDLWRWAKPLLKKLNSGSSAIEKSRIENHNSHKIQANGLICLKGGELKEEIAESKTHPKLYRIQEYLYDAYFLNKYILYLELDPPKSSK